MRAAIDTCSLISLVRYYLPFDNKSRLYDLVFEKIESKELFILDKIVQECKYTSKGIVIKEFDYLDVKKNQLPTELLLPNSRFFNLVEHQFVHSAGKKKLDEVEFEKVKGNFLESADAKLVLFGLQQKKLQKPITIITEETEASNDNKAFKKLPAICKIVDVDVMTLPQYLPRIGINMNLR